MISYMWWCWSALPSSIVAMKFLELFPALAVMAQLPQPHSGVLTARYSCTQTGEAMSLLQSTVCAGTNALVAAVILGSMSKLPA